MSVGRLGSNGRHVGTPVERQLSKCPFGFEGSQLLTGSFSQFIERRSYSTMQPNSLGHISARSSSVSLAKSQEPIDDDRSIARELLHGALYEKPPLTRNAVSLQGLDGSRPRKSDILITSNSIQDGRAWRTARTSNTWTSSEGDVLEDQDEIDDRTVFIEEYNRLAKKVMQCNNVSQMLNLLTFLSAWCKNYECRRLRAKQCWLSSVISTLNN